MKITLIEDVYNVLRGSDIAMTSKEIIEKLQHNKKSKRNAVAQSILVLKGVKGCDMMTFERDMINYHIMTSDKEYLEIRPLTLPQLIIKIMSGKSYYQSINHMYDKALTMGCDVTRWKFGNSICMVAKYNQCEIISTGNGHKKEYKMVSDPVRPYTIKASKVREVDDVYVDDGHCRSSVDLLFSGSALEAAKQNKTMIADWCR